LFFFFFFFFFQAEDGIRDLTVTGVQTCALPIWFKYSLGSASDLKRAVDILVSNKRKFDKTTNQALFDTYIGQQGTEAAVVHKVRSEERRVGKECRCRW